MPNEIEDKIYYEIYISAQYNYPDLFISSTFSPNYLATQSPWNVNTVA